MPDSFKPTKFHSERYGFGGQSSLSQTKLWESWKSIQMGSPQSLSGNPQAVSLSSFYKGGSFVSDSDGSILGNIPTSGKISFGNFRIKPYYDVVYLGIKAGDQNFTFTVPETCGFSHMKIFIQGAGASGQVGPWNWSGRGGISSSFITAPAGGNGGDYAQTYPIPVTGGDILTIRAGWGGKALGGSQNGGHWGFQGYGNSASGGNSYVYKNGSNVLTVAGASSSNNHIRQSAFDSGTKSLETQGYTLSGGYASGPGTGNKVTIYDNSKLELHYAGGWGGTSYLVACLVSNASTLTSSPNFNYGSSIFGGGGAPGYQTAGDPGIEGLSHDIRGRGYGWRNSQSDWISEVTPTHGGNIGSPGKGFDEIFTRSSTSGLGYGFGGAGEKGYNGQSVATNNNQGGPGFVRIMFYDVNDVTHTTGITYDRTKARFPA